MTSNNRIGKVCWFDIPVTDFKSARSFYGELFGWKFVPGGDDYFFIQVGEELIGGLRKAKGSRTEADSPVVYITVEKLDSSAEKAVKKGAVLVGDKMITSEDGGAHQWIRDSDNNLIALWAKP